MIISTDLIVNGDFENTTDKVWVLSGSSQIEYEGDAENHYCEINSTASIMQTITLKPNTKYQVQVDCRGNATGTLSLVTLGLYPATLGEWKINTAKNAEWHTETYSFTTQDFEGGARLHIQVPWNSAGAPVDVDNVKLLETEFECHAPQWVDLVDQADGTEIFEFQSRSDVNTQHYQLYRDGVMIMDYPQVESDVIYDTDKMGINSVFILKAIDDNSGESYVVFEGTEKDLYESGVIEVDDI
ncbi:carbohydrate binding domain-containing protein [Kluyvera ascorbata]|uniref:carbohydrate binding domain-containing protein n=1 Tax=Kluyvera ascorbata TaxID=51288 RepID=UPI00356AA975